MNVNVVGNQVLLRSHVLCDIMSQFPPNIEVTTTQRTDESLKDRS